MSKLNDERQNARSQIEIDPPAGCCRSAAADALFRRHSLRCNRGVERVERVTANAGAVLVEPGEPWHYYWLVLEGEVRAERPEPDGTLDHGRHCAQPAMDSAKPPFSPAKATSTFRISAGRIRYLSASPSRISGRCWPVALPCARSFWPTCAQRMQAYQVEALHREKLVSLGTLAAGLMHELHNPGSAAKRAASQLRENLLRLQQLSLRSSEKPKTAGADGVHERSTGARFARLQSVRHEQRGAGRRRGGHEPSGWSRRRWKTPSPLGRRWWPWASIAKRSPARRNTSIRVRSLTRSTGLARCLQCHTGLRH